jgi:hypothetical protein
MKALKMEETKLETKKIVERNKSFILNTHVREYLDEFGTGIRR